MPDEKLTNSDKTTIAAFQDSLSFKNGKYEVNLPWREDHPDLPDNYSLSKRRLYSVLKKLQQNPELLRAYTEVFIDYLKRDYIEEIGPSTPVHPEGKLHYLPHSGVLKKSNTTALRIVFDASSNFPSLNSCLYSGPTLLTELGKSTFKI